MKGEPIYGVSWSFSKSQYIHYGHVLTKQCSVSFRSLEFGIHTSLVKELFVSRVCLSANDYSCRGSVRLNLHLLSLQSIHLSSETLTTTHVDNNVGEKTWERNLPNDEPAFFLKAHYLTSFIKRKIVIARTTMQGIHTIANELFL